MNMIIDVTVECGTQKEIDLIGEIIRKTLPDNPVLIHDENVIVKVLNPPPNEMLLAEYWAAKEMAETICISVPIFYFFLREENYLIQMLKKEWHR